MQTVLFLTFSESKQAITLPFSTWQLLGGWANLHSSSLREQFPLWNCRHTSRVSHFVSLTEFIPNAMPKGHMIINGIFLKCKSIVLFLRHQNLYFGCFLLHQDNESSIRWSRKNVDRSIRNDQRNVFNWYSTTNGFCKKWMQLCCFRSTFSHQYSLPSCIIAYFNFLGGDVVQRGNKGSSKADAFVCPDERRAMSKDQF